MLRRGFQVDTVDCFARQISQRDGHHARRSADANEPEKLKACSRPATAGCAALDARKASFRSEGRIELIRSERACVERTRDKLPKRVEVREAPALRIVVVCRRVMHVSSDPDDVAYALLAHEAQQVGYFELAAERRARVGIGDTLECGLPVADDKTNRQVAGDHLPGGS